jgi:hypothetical protein
MRERVNRLERRFARLTRFRATIDVPHRRPYKRRHHALRFEEKGALDTVIDHAGAWFEMHLRRSPP